MALSRETEVICYVISGRKGGTGKVIVGTPLRIDSNSYRKGPRRAVTFHLKKKIPTSRAAKGACGARREVSFCCIRLQWLLLPPFYLPGE